jgi:hypothetical protein
MQDTGFRATCSRAVGYLLLRKHNTRERTPAMRVMRYASRSIKISLPRDVLQKAASLRQLVLVKQGDEY